MRNWRNLKHRHYGETIYFTAFAATSGLRWVPLPHPLSRVVDTISMVVVLGAFLLMQIHDRGNLCETCITDMPLDTEEAVRRKRPLLRLFHWAYRTRLKPPLLLLLALIALGVYLGKGTAGQAEKTLTDGLLLVLLVAASQHHKLYLWCPWCREDGGNDEEAEAPAPVVPQAA